MRAADQFHIGVVVEDLDAALASLSALFGYRWSEEVRVDQEVDMPDGPIPVAFRFRYSRDEPRVEVIESRPGTLWTPVAGSGLHHVGYWSDDVAADAATLEAAGYTPEARGGSVDGGPPTWTYHRHPAGPRVELVSRSLGPFLAALWS